MDALSPEVRDLLALKLVPGIGPRLTAALLERFGSAGGVLAASVSELASVPHVGDKLAGAICRALHDGNVEAEVERLAAHEVRLLALGSPEYPPSLAEIHDPPPLVYLRGALKPEDARAVALVGSRQCTAYGRRVAERLAAGLVRAGYTVVSGLARGIDGVAHRAALEGGGRTLAVLAGGLARVYPPEHKDLARQVAAAGAVLSESSMEMEPMAGLFPARNRLISGLSQAVVLVEAAERSGALITASHAADQGKRVFAVPGPIDSDASSGTNALIRKGAVLLRGVEDVVEELEGVAAVLSPAAAPEPPLNEEERRVWLALAEGPRHVDDLARKLGMPIPALCTLLLTLEMKKTLRRLPGNQYERC
jgi:DNA processing protein